jgi:hypothetical protein
MKYHHYEIFSPQRDPSHTVITPNEKLAERTTQLLERFDKLAALRDAYAARAEKGQRRLPWFERLLAYRDSGRAVKTADVVDWNDIDRAWRAHAVAGLVVAKLYALHHTAPGEVAQPKNQTDREPALHELWRHYSVSARANASGGRQGYELSFYRVIQESPALARFRPEVFYDGPRQPRAFPFKRSLPELTR